MELQKGYYLVQDNEEYVNPKCVASECPFIKKNKKADDLTNYKLVYLFNIKKNEEDQVRFLGKFDIEYVVHNQYGISYEHIDENNAAKFFIRKISLQEIGIDASGLRRFIIKYIFENAFMEKITRSKSSVGLVVEVIKQGWPWDMKNMLGFSEKEIFRINRIFYYQSSHFK